MPWSESTKMDEKLKFVARYLDGESISDLCREFGISRVTGHKVIARYRESGLDAQKQTLANYDITGTDPLCKTAVTRPKEAGEVWAEGVAIQPHASTLCTLAAIGKLQASGKKLRVAYVYDKALGIKVFADKAFYAANAADPKKPVIVPFLLKKDAEAHATSIGGKLVGYAEAVALATVPF